MGVSIVFIVSALVSFVLTYYLGTIIGQVQMNKEVNKSHSRVLEYLCVLHTYGVGSPEAENMKLLFDFDEAFVTRAKALDAVFGITADRKAKSPPVQKHTQPLYREGRWKSNEGD